MVASSSQDESQEKGNRWSFNPRRSKRQKVDRKEEYWYFSREKENRSVLIIIISITYPQYDHAMD